MGSSTTSTTARRGASLASLLFVLSPCLVSAAYDNRIIPDAKEGEFTRFRSRPDLQVPVWDIQVYDETKLAPGYWFVSPYENVHPPEKDKPNWVTPCIYDTNGELLWSAANLFDHRNTQDFRLSNVLGQDALTMIWQDGGVGLALDRHYEKINEIHIGVNMDTLNIHDWNWVDNGTKVLNFKKYYGKASKEESAEFHYDGKCGAEYQIFYERDAVTGEPLFEWNAFDHIPLNDSTFPSNNPNRKPCGGGWWDFMHANAIDKCDDGEFVLSARHTDTIYKIQRDGQIRWRLGGLKSDFQSDFKFSRQHDVRCYAQNETTTLITFLDNAVAPDPAPKSHAFSRGLLLAVDERPDKMTASVVQTYDHPRKKFSDGRGGMQILPNKNVIMGWSQGGRHSEYSEDGTLLMEAKFIPGYLRTYRTYKFPFVGQPKRAPDVLSEVVKDNKTSIFQTDVYASWNGATEVKFWNLYKSDSKGKVEVLISTAPKETFETKLSHKGFASYVVAEALDADGNSLGKSKVVKTDPRDDLPSSVVSAELKWLQNPTANAVDSDSDSMNGGGSGDSDAAASGSQILSGARALYFFVGFIVCAALVGGGAWFLQRRRRRHYLNSNGGGGAGLNGSATAVKNGASSWAPKFMDRQGQYAPVAHGEKLEDAFELDDSPRESTEDFSGEGSGSGSGSGSSRKRSGSFAE